MKRVTKTAAGLIAALVLGVASLSVSQAWAGIGERSTADTKIETRTNVRGQSNITSDRQDIDAASNETGVIDQNGVADLTLNVQAQMQPVETLQAKAGVDSPAGRSLVLATVNGAPVTQARNASFGRRMLNKLFSIKGEQFGDVADGRAGSSRGLVSAPVASMPEAMAAAQLNPKSKSGFGAVDGGRAIDFLLIGSGVAPAIYQVASHSWYDALSTYGMVVAFGAVWLFAGIWVNGANLIPLAGSGLAYGVAGIAHAVSFGLTQLSNLGTMLMHIPAVDYAYDWLLKVANVLWTSGASVASAVATSAQAHAAAWIHGLQWVTDPHLLWAYAPQLAIGYTVALVSSARYIGEIVAGVSNWAEKAHDMTWGSYIVTGVVAGARALFEFAISPFRFAKDFITKDLYNAAKPIWDLFKPVWTFIKEQIVPRIGYVARAAVLALTTAIVHSTVTAAVLAVGVAGIVAGGVKRTAQSVYGSMAKDGKTLAGLAVSAIVTIALTGLLGLAGFSVWYFGSSPAISGFVKGVTLLFGAWGFIEGGLLGYAYGFKQIVPEARKLGLSLLGASERLLGIAGKMLA